MPDDRLFESVHFTLEQLTDGVYACIHKPGGAAYSNAGIVDLGDRIVLVDSLNTLVAGRTLRQTAEALFELPVETIVLTHAHSDHWMGASVFDASTTFLASQTAYQECLRWGEDVTKDFENPAEWEAWLAEIENKLQIEKDERVRVGLEKSITYIHYALAEMDEFKPRFPDSTFEDKVIFSGSKRSAELHSFGRGHSDDDSVMLLPQDGIAFIGDIGFFDFQPFLGFCDINLYRQQLLFFQDSDFQILVPGHGTVGDKSDIAFELKYFDVMEELVSEVVRRGGTLEEAKQISLPEPFDRWLIGGMERFEVNVRYLFKHFGGELTEDH
jgi:cyclase